MTSLHPLLFLAAGEGGGSGGLLDPEPGILIWTWVTFACLFLVLARFVWKPLLGALDKRESTIREALEAAERLKSEADKRMAEYEERMAKSHLEAQAVVDEGRRDAEVLRREIESKAQGEAQKIIDRGKREIELARDHALEQIRTEVVDLSLQVAERLVKKNLTTDDNKRLAQEALQGLGKEGDSQGRGGERG